MEQGDNKMLPVESARYNTLIFKLNPFSNNLIRFYSPRVILERNWPNVDKLFVQAGVRTQHYDLDVFRIEIEKNKVLPSNVLSEAHSK